MYEEVLIFLPSLWKNPVKVSCKCEDKLKKKNKENCDSLLAAAKLFFFLSHLVSLKNPADEDNLSVVPWRILLSLHFFHCLQHVIHFEYFPKKRNFKKRKKNMFLIT